MAVAIWFCIAKKPTWLQVKDSRLCGETKAGLSLCDWIGSQARRQKTPLFASPTERWQSGALQISKVSGTLLGLLNCFHNANDMAGICGEISRGTPTQKQKSHCKKSNIRKNVMRRPEEWGAIFVERKKLYWGIRHLKLFWLQSYKTNEWGWKRASKDPQPLILQFLLLFLPHIFQVSCTYEQSVQSIRKEVLYKNARRTVFLIVIKQTSSGRLACLELPAKHSWITRTAFETPKQAFKRTGLLYWFKVNCFSSHTHKYFAKHLFQIICTALIYINKGLCKGRGFSKKSVATEFW